MSIKVIKQVMPERAVKLLKNARWRFQKARREALPALTEADFVRLLAEDLELVEGDAVLVHSSTDGLKLDFSFGRVLALIRTVVGTRGTVLFPTYPGLPSYEFLARGEVFDVRRTPSYMGLLTEYARRQPGAVRSLHPTKSVCAVGRLARELTATHHLSPYPYDRPSPYRKLVELGGKSVGLGVTSERMSLVHCAEDELREAFPVRTYHPQLFAARCIDEAGELVTVETYAHNLSKMNHHIPRFVRRHLSSSACRDLKIHGSNFFRADAARLFEEMVRCAREGVTIYPRSAARD
ncbi:MAG TPA: AAC(3) family N-acetyltransferase [Pyrinomonadaceae bacterium]|nr:AAC(3) family N-acetyltransferase [Pyrinomonadaceae bacterium]